MPSPSLTPVRSKSKKLQYWGIKMKFMPGSEERAKWWWLEMFCSAAWPHMHLPLVHQFFLIGFCIPTPLHPDIICYVSQGMFCTGSYAELALEELRKTPVKCKSFYCSSKRWWWPFKRFNWEAFSFFAEGNVGVIVWLIVNHIHKLQRAA